MDPLSLALLAFLLMALMAIMRLGGYLLAGAAAAVLVVIVIERTWRPSSPAAARARRAVTAIGAIAGYGAVVWLGVMMTPGDHDYREDQRQVERRMLEIARQPGIEDRFVAMQEAARSGSFELSERVMQRRLLEWLGALDPQVELSPRDLAAAEAVQAREVSGMCDASAWNAYPSLRLRQHGVHEVADVLESFPRLDHCRSAQTYLYLVQRRCLGIWRDRCRHELPRERLASLRAREPMIASAIEQLLLSAPAERQ